MAHLESAHLRTARTIQELAAPALARLAPGGLVTLRQVEVTRDRRHASLHYSVLGTDAAAVHEALVARLGELRSCVAKGMHTRRVPQLSLHQVPAEAIEPLCLDS